MPFVPKHLDKKRSSIIPPVRVTEEERRVAEWLTERLEKEDGVNYAIADMVRVAIGTLLEKELARAEAAGEAVPEWVKEMAPSKS